MLCIELLRNQMLKWSFIFMSCWILFVWLTSASVLCWFTYRHWLLSYNLASTRIALPDFTSQDVLKFLQLWIFKFQFYLTQHINCIVFYRKTFASFIFKLLKLFSMFLIVSHPSQRCTETELWCRTAPAGHHCTTHCNTAGIEDSGAATKLQLLTARRSDEN